MNEVIVINRDELHNIIENTARIAGAEGARLALSKIKLSSSSKKDKISEEEAMKLLGCKKRTLASLRNDRQITFHTTTRPYTYSKQSILDYIEFKKIKKVDL